MMNNQLTFQYNGYQPLTDFNSLKDYESLTALIVLLADLEGHIPGVINHILSVVSLIDGGFRLNNSVSKESSGLAMSVQKEFLEVIHEKIAELSDQPQK